MDVGEPVDQRGGDGAGERVVGGAVAGADHDGALGQFVVADPAVQDQRVERLLHVRRGRVQLVQEQAVRLVAGDRLAAGRTPSARPGSAARRSGPRARAGCPAGSRTPGPSYSANSLTREDFPIPGAPQRNTGRTVARPSSSSGTREGVTVTAACTQGLLEVREGRRENGEGEGREGAERPAVGPGVSGVTRVTRLTVGAGATELRRAEAAQRVFRRVSPAGHVRGSRPPSRGGPAEGRTGPRCRR